MSGREGKPGPDAATQGEVVVEYGPVEYTDEAGTRWRIETDGGRTGWDARGNEWHIDPGGRVTSFEASGRIGVRDTDGTWRLTDPNGSILEKDSDGVLRHTDADGRVWTWSHLRGEWRRFQPATDGSRWDWDDMRGDFVERATPHPTRPAVERVSPDGHTVVREVFGNLFLTSPRGSFVRFGTDITGEAPHLSGWRAVDEAQFTQTLAHNENMEVLRSSPERWERLEYASSLLDLTETVMETTVDVAVFAARFAGPWGRAFATVMDLLATGEALEQARTDEEKMMILSEAMMDAFDRGIEFGSSGRAGHTAGATAAPDPVDPKLEREVDRALDGPLELGSHRGYTPTRDPARRPDVEGPTADRADTGQRIPRGSVERARDVLGQRLDSNEAVAAAWERAKEHVLHGQAPGGRGDVVDKGGLYDRTRERFWREVSEPGSEARRYFEASGFRFDSEGRTTRAPMHESLHLYFADAPPALRDEFRVSLDHILPKAKGDNWKAALDPDNLRFVVQAENRLLHLLDRLGVLDWPPRGAADQGRIPRNEDADDAPVPPGQSERAEPGQQPRDQPGASAPVVRDPADSGAVVPDGDTNEAAKQGAGTDVEPGQPSERSPGEAAYSTVAEAMARSSQAEMQPTSGPGAGAEPTQVAAPASASGMTGVEDRAEANVSGSPAVATRSGGAAWDDRIPTGGYLDDDEETDPGDPGPTGGYLDDDEQADPGDPGSTGGYLDDEPLLEAQMSFLDDLPDSGAAKDSWQGTEASQDGEQTDEDGGEGIVAIQPPR